MTNYTYQIGGSLQTNAPCYVTRKADFQLYNALKAGEFCYILNSRQMGKSSLLVQTRNRLQQDGFKCTSIDMTRIGSENITPLQWYKGIVTELSRGFKLLGKFNLKKWWQESEEVSLLQKLSNFLEDVLLDKFPQDRLIIFIDEIDGILSLDFPIDDFFALIRFCYNQRAINPAYNRLTFAIFGVATPSDLIADKKRTPFNIGTAIELEGFNLEEALPLATGLEAQIENSQVVLKKILSWTGGQPFLTQKLCQLMLNILSERLKESKNNTEAMSLPPGTEDFWVETVVKSQIIQKWESQDEPEHLRTIRDRIQRNEEKAGRLLGIYQQILQGLEVEADDSREQIELILSGLVVKNGGLLKVKNRIYREVFDLEWVEKQLGLLRPYSQSFDAWIAAKKTDKSRLLRGRALQDAQTWARGKSLSDLDYQFLAASEKLDRKEMQLALEAERTKEVEARLRQEQKTARLQRLFLGVVSGALIFAIASSAATFLQYRKAAINEIDALVKYSEALFAADKTLDSLVEAIRTRKRWQQLAITDAEIAAQVDKVLRQAVYQVVEYNRFSGHKAGLTAVDITADGEIIATSSFDDTAKLWKRDGTLLTTFTGHRDRVLNIAISPKGDFVVSAGFDKSLQIWKPDGTLVKTIAEHKEAVRGIAIDPGGEIIASGSADATIKLWQSDGTFINTIDTKGKAIWAIAFSPDGKIIASGGDDKTVKLWKLDGTLLTTLKGHTETVWGIDFSPDGKLLATSSGDKTVKLWKIEGNTAALLHTLRDHQAVVWGVAFSPDGKKLASASGDKTVKLWNIDGTLLTTLKDPTREGLGVVFNPDGKMLISASGGKTAKLWRLEETLLTMLKGHSGQVAAVAASPLGNVIVTVSNDKTIGLWKREEGVWKRDRTIEHPEGLGAVAFSPDGKTFATGSSDREVQLWSREGELLKTFQGHKGTVFAVAFSPDGKAIASAGEDKSLKIWDIETGEYKTILGHTHAIWGVSFSPDGKLLATASGDGVVNLWGNDGKLLQTFKEHRDWVMAVAFAPDGKAIATASNDKTVKLWQLGDNCQQTDRCLSKCCASLTLEGHQGEVWGVAFSPDGKMLATASHDRTVKLWKRDGTLLATLYGHQDDLLDVAFSPDGRAIATGSKDGIAIVWDLDEIADLDKVVVYGCDWLRDYLRTNAEVEESDRNICDRPSN